MPKKKIIRPYYVLTWDFNIKDLQWHDVMPYLVDTFKEDKRKRFKIFCNGHAPETFDDYKRFVHDASQYRYWARCEYELVTSGFPPQDKSVKIDVHEQVLANIDTVTELFIQNVK